MNQKGITLLELVVATALFGSLVLIAGSIHQGVIQSQRSAIASQDIQESVRYALEVMGKEIRHAKGDLRSDECKNGGGYSTYNVGGSPYSNYGPELYFKNKNGQCVRYYPDGSGRLKIARSGVDLPVTVDLPVAPDEIKIVELLFRVNDYEEDILPGDKFQPMVTIRMAVEMTGGQARDKHRMEIQTTISSRSYKDM